MYGDELKKAMETHALNVQTLSAALFEEIGALPSHQSIYRWLKGSRPSPIWINALKNVFKRLEGKTK